MRGYTKYKGSEQVKSIYLPVLLLASVAFLGCGPDTSGLPKTVVAEGIVTLDGAPVEGATVSIVPDSGEGYGAAGKTDAEGKYSLDAFPGQKTGAVPGSYKVKISKTVLDQGDDGADIGTVNVSYGLPKKYAAIGTSKLTLTIPDADSTDLNFELQGK